MHTLIYFKENELAPTGGPKGYLYNLNKELKRLKISNIEFLNEKINEDSKIKRIYKRIETKPMKRFKEIFRNGVTVALNVIENNKKMYSKIDFNKYDIIHFHSTLSMYLVKDSLESYKGKVLLTSHTPEVAYKEMIEENASKFNKIVLKNKLKKLEIIDQYAFERADYIIFPTEEAEEPYFHTWEKFKNIKDNHTEKFKYIPTGINEIKLDESINFRKKYNIPDNAFVVSYVGRHNEIKGYDQLKKIGKTILEKYPDVYFMIGGIEKPLKGINNDRWIEVGWTNKAHELINSSNLFVLPNKETYFDLVLLEVMNIGKNVVLTNTGGNKYFKQFDSSELYYYDYEDIDSACKNIENAYQKFKNHKLTEIDNKRIFENNFTIEKFTNNYLNLLNDIYYEDSNEKINNK